MFSFVSSAQTVGVEVGVAASSYDAVSNHDVNPNAPRTNITTMPKPGLVLGAGCYLKEMPFLTNNVVQSYGKRKANTIRVKNNPGTYSQTEAFG